MSRPVLLLMQSEDPSDSVSFFVCFQSNRRHGQSLKLLAAGTKATVTLPDRTKVTSASLNTALAVLASEFLWHFICLCVRDQFVSKQQSVDTL